MANSTDPLAVHKRLGGKIEIAVKDQVDSPEKLSTYYTPGVGEVSQYLAEHPEQVGDYTNTHNTVAIVSDGSAVLGLGNIGPEGALPVMEGKSMLFKSFAGIDGIPLVLNTNSVDEIVSTVAAVAPSFGGINLEDIKAPECFEVESRLKDELDIPVFHDDQHGTAVVTLAALINSCRVVGRELDEAKIVISGAGAAGIAIAKLLDEYAQPDIYVVDSKGVISPNRNDLNSEKQQLLTFSNQLEFDGSLEQVLEGADIFIGVSKGDLIDASVVKTMNKAPIVFAMSNPTPEIMPDEAKAGGAAIVATGRSDFPNQINNALVFPGIFRGALDNNVSDITNQHKISAAEAIAELVDEPTAEHIIPSIFDQRLVPAVAAKIV